MKYKLPVDCDPEVVEMHRQMEEADKNGTQLELIAKFKEVLKEPDLNVFGHMLYECAIALMEAEIKERETGYNC